MHHADESKESSVEPSAEADVISILSRGISHVLSRTFYLAIADGQNPEVDQSYLSCLAFLLDRLSG